MKIFKLLAPLTILALLLTSCPPPLDQTPASDAKNMTSFMFTAALNPGVLLADASATYNDVSGKWVVGPLPVGTNVSALVGSFELSAKASASIGGVAQVSGVTSNSYAADVYYTITAEDGSTAAAIVSVSVTIPGTGKNLLTYSLPIRGIARSQTIASNAVAMSVPYGTDISAPMVATFTLSDPTAKASIGGTAQISGTTANTFVSGVAQTYRITAEDGTFQDYTVTLTVLPISAQILEVCPSYSSVYVQSAREWIDIKLFNVANLGTGWKVKLATGSTAAATLLDSSSTTEMPALVLGALLDGDIIRLHSTGYTAKDTTADKTADGVNADRWDLVATSGTNFATYHGIIWLEKSDGSIVDFVAYASSTNNGWVTGANLTTLQNAVAASQWDSSAVEGALAYGIATSNTARLTDAAIALNKDGNSVTDWKSYAAPLVVLGTPTVDPTWAEVTPSTGKDVAFSVPVSLYGGATISAMTIDLSNAVFGGTTTEALTDGGSGAYTRTFPIPAGTVTETQHTLTIICTASVPVANKIVKLIVSPNPAPGPVLAFANADFEAALVGPPAGAALYTADKHAGESSYRYSASLSKSATTLVSSTTKFNALGLGYTKISFWFKGSVTGEGPALRFQLGGGGSVLNYFDMNGIQSGVTYTPVLTTGGSYVTSPEINVTEWTQVIVDISALAFSGTGTPPVTSLTTAILAYRTRSPSVHDWMIDDVQYLP